MRRMLCAITGGTLYARYSCYALIAVIGEARSVSQARQAVLCHVERFGPSWSLGSLPPTPVGLSLLPWQFSLPGFVLLLLAACCRGIPGVVLRVVAQVVCLAPGTQVGRVAVGRS